MYKPRLLIAAGALLLAVAMPGWAVDATPADSSGNGLLNGKYWVRQVIFSLNSSTAKVASSIGVTGAITFDGRGRYTFTGQTFDSISNKLSPATRSATYRVGANGVTSIDSLVFGVGGAAEVVYGGVGSNGIFTGAAAEGAFTDMLVAIPAGTKILTNSSLTGSYWIGHMDFPSGEPRKARNSAFKVTASGSGTFDTVTVTGRDASLPVTSTSRPLTQSVTSASYNFASDGSAALTFPPPAGTAAASALFTGTKTLYVSADGNYLLGGDPSGYDIFFGFRPLTATTQSATSAAFFGVYYFSSIDSDMSDTSVPYFVAENGSINAFQGLKFFWHQRTSSYNSKAYDFTYDSSNTGVATDGSLVSNYYKTIVSADGQAVMTVGNATDYSMLVGVHAPGVGTGEVFLNPLGVLNAASFSPVTFPVSPGELLTLFGTNLATSTATASTLPFPSSLAGTQVMINDRPAPVFVVSPGQVSVIVPYATSGPYAKIQVINNGKPSNVVTMYNRACSLGVFAVPSTGSGYGAVLHANFQLVSASNPAKQGEIVLIYLTGMGEVTPAVTDGAPGPTSPLSLTSATFFTFVGDKRGTILYSGIAPGLAGLYQLNVQIPKDAATGDVTLDISGAGCEAAQVRIPIVAGQ